LGTDNIELQLATAYSKVSTESNLSPLLIGSQGAMSNLPLSTHHPEKMQVLALIVEFDLLYTDSSVCVVP